MFTGIIEATGLVTNIVPDKNNLHISLHAPFVNELKIDQSIAHNGVCLTVVDILDNTYTVTAVEETLKKSNLQHLQPGSLVNLERCITANARFDGHFVQGHVDTTAECTEITDRQGSHLITFRYNKNHAALLVDKGSITINGVSLTVVDPHDDLFSVAVIPYTFNHTNFKQLATGSKVNIEFDILGKYVVNYLKGKHTI